MESTVSSSITSHIAIHNLSNPHQWAYKKGHTTELLLVKMTEHWRRALDNNETVGIVFVDFKKAFDSLSHSVLLQKFQGLGITGDIWLWVKDYLANRNQVTTVNGCGSSLRSVALGVPQGSVIGPTLFLLFCNDLTDIIVIACEGELHMYADDSTIHVTDSNPDMVASSVNFFFKQTH